MTTDALREFAPAKVNLCLHVIGRRADGKHLLESLVAFVDIGDMLETEPSPMLSLSLDGPFGDMLGRGDNLVLRAAEMLRGPTDGAALRLFKNLPVAAGIGGGSADAAAALRLLGRLWGARSTPEQALALGADVPVCLRSETTWMTGIGETLTPARLPEGVGCVLVNPLRGVSTAAVFGRLELPEDAPPPPAMLYAKAEDLFDALQATRNDLIDAAIGLRPEIPAMLAALDQTGAAITRMSGSGGTCFGLYPTRAAAERAAAKLAAAEPGWWAEAGTLYR